jgi:hypothetical protein
MSYLQLKLKIEVKAGGFLWLAVNVYLPTIKTKVQEALKWVINLPYEFRQ